MGNENHQLHMFFFPFMAQGHIIPLIDMAKLFAMRGVKATLITTPVNAPFFSKTIEKSKIEGHEIDILTMKFPCVEAGLPEGCEHLDLATSPAMKQNFRNATAMLAQPLKQLLTEYRPDCLVADTFFPWSANVAANIGIPRIVFQGTCFFSSCATECVRLYEPHKKVTSDSDPFLIPNFPGEIKLKRKQIPDFLRHETNFTKFYREAKESDLRSYGVLFNSFYELEPAYADHYKKALGRKAWHIGPVSLCNRDVEDKAYRGKEAPIDEHECLKWLNSKEPHSVLYVCFGSSAHFTSSQLLEIAMGIEASGQQFIWVLRENKKDQENKGDWLPEGYEKRIEGKGLIIRGWVPQLLILEHEAVGGFLTHCGWNSTLEAITAGLPMATWPVTAEQFYNEKLVTEILRIGVGVGARQWVSTLADGVKKEGIQEAVIRIMVGEEAEEMRSTARKFGEMARRAFEEGGSSHSDLNAFIEELRSKQM